MSNLKRTYDESISEINKKNCFENSISIKVNGKISGKLNGKIIGNFNGRFCSDFASSTFNGYINGDINGKMIGLFIGEIFINKFNGKIINDETLLKFDESINDLLNNEKIITVKTDLLIKTYLNGEFIGNFDKYGYGIKFKGKFNGNYNGYLDGIFTGKMDVKSIDGTFNITV